MIQANRLPRLKIMILGITAWTIGLSAPSLTGEPTPPSASAETLWSFQPPTRHDPPLVRHQEWSSRPIDRFILARLEEAGRAPSPPASRTTLLRRVTFDLTGLPPTPAEIEAFLADNSPNAYEKVVDRLLASPAYGERWARLWLDVARYAEDQAHIVGNNKELFYPNAYLYRDWVIQALNADMPFDRFVNLQLAADLIEPDNPDHRPALGFMGLGPKYYRRNSKSVMADEWEDRVDTLTRGLLGLTVACARCHDHKFDPIPTEDYYALASVFASTEMFNKPLPGSKKNGEKQDKENKKKKKTEPDEAMHIVKEGEPTNLHVFIRGDVNNPGREVDRRFLQALSDGEPAPFEVGSGRRELAEAITSRDNPLTARVIVNRIWGQIFGQPIVGTPSNFGSLGERPTHPRLLDDLSVRFMDAGWSLKWLLRELVLSSTYRQESGYSATDPENTLLGHMNRKRLSIEAWRDSVLAVSGSLDRAVGGQSIDPQNPDERRRTVYSEASRFQLNPMLAMFDFPDPNAHAAHRAETTTPLQKMFVLNHPFMVEHARVLAERLRAEIPDGPNADEKRIDRAYRYLFARPPQLRERELALRFLRTGADRGERWQRYAHVLLASNEMLYLD